MTKIGNPNKDCNEEEDHERDDDHLLPLPSPMMTTYANTCFKSFFFEAALATMLAMTTIFIAVAVAVAVAVASLTKPSSYTTWSKTWSKACRLHYEVSHPVK